MCVCVSGGVCLCACETVPLRLPDRVDFAPSRFAKDKHRLSSSLTVRENTESTHEGSVQRVTAGKLEFWTTNDPVIDRQVDREIDR